MLEAILSTLLFWATFSYSPGPFWSAIMQAAPSTSTGKLYREYTMYYCTGWLSFCVFCAVFTGLIGAFSPHFTAWMHVLGVGVILWLALKVLKSQQNKNKSSFTLGWKLMNVVTWTNPKAYLLIPIGALSANFTDSIISNAFIFWLLGIPLFFSGLMFWIILGRIGAKISMRALSLFNVGLLSLFATYLSYEGYNQIQALYDIPMLF